MRVRSACCAALASLALLASPAWPQLLCPADPPLRIEKGPYLTRGFELTSAEFDAWLGNVRETCDWLAALDAGDVPYAPAVGGDWTDPDPADVAAALDALAAGGGGGGTSIAEGLTTACTIGEGIVSDGAGAMDCSAAALSQVGHAHAASDTTSGTFADARISATSVTQHETALEAVLDLADLQGDLALGTKTSGNYAAGDAEAGAALTGDSATAFFSSGTIEPARLGSGSGGSTKFLREDSTWQTVTAGISGSLGSTDECVVRADGTGGSTIQCSTLRVTDGGVVQLGGTGSGDPALWRRTGEDNLLVVTANLGGWADAFANSFQVNTDTSPVARIESAGLRLGSGVKILGQDNTNVASGSADVMLSRGSAGVWYFEDALRLKPRSAPPVTCGSANTEGALYMDSDSHELCVCDGTSWTGLIAAGACS